MSIAVTLAGKSNVATQSTEHPAPGFGVARKSNVATQSTEREAFKAIDREREERGISRSALCRAADIAPFTWDRIKSGRTSPQRGVLIRLKRALAQLAGEAKRRPPDVIGAVYRAAYIEVARASGLDPASVDWPRSTCNYGIHAAVGRCRQAAFYLTVTALDVPRPAAARAVGYEKAAASKALKDVEARREADASFDTLILTIGALLMGRDLS